MGSTTPLNALEEKELRYFFTLSVIDLAVAGDTINNNALQRHKNKPSTLFMLHSSSSFVVYSKPSTGRTSWARQTIIQVCQSFQVQWQHNRGPSSPMFLSSENSSPYPIREDHSTHRASCCICLLPISIRQDCPLV